MSVTITKPVVNGSNNTWGATVNTALDTLSEHAIPSGGIIMWSGLIADIPTGWHLCDGTNSTPDLRNSFVVGAGDEYTKGDTGGAKTTNLTSGQLPSHTHTFSATSGTTTGLDGQFQGIDDNNTSYKLRIGLANGVFSTSNHTGPYISSETKVQNSTYPSRVNFNGNNHTHSVSGTTASVGDGDDIENRPPYYALAYIMKA